MGCWDCSVRPAKEGRGAERAAPVWQGGGRSRRAMAKGGGRRHAMPEHFRLVESEGRGAPVSLVRVHRSSPWTARDARNAPLEVRAVEAAASAREAAADGRLTRALFVLVGRWGTVRRRLNFN